ncbi:GCK domain-containing protein [Dioscorea alata]|uniref:GCK domain-containing protein n=1 Tax=Dioscorea alata TaxID=55571 RepID=A0ACB7UE37_DIOAL|nr:GCK domain-containing protein [Dioscorea alata]
MASSPISSAETLAPSPPETEPDSTKPAVDAEGDGGEDGKKEEEEEEEEEEAECGFCIFMKGGGCKESFVAWEKCVEDAEKSGEDVVEKCFQVTSLLKKCMDDHADYYEPVLKAEQAMADAVAAEIHESSSEPSEPQKSSPKPSEPQKSSEPEN